VRAGGVDHPGVGILDHRDGLARGIVRQTKDHDVRLVETRAATLDILALGVV
jgi:hypothetical protein